MTTIFFHSMCGSSFRLEDYECVCYGVAAYRLTLIYGTNQVTQMSLHLILHSSSLRSITPRVGLVEISCSHCAVGVCMYVTESTPAHHFSLSFISFFSYPFPYRPFTQAEVGEYQST